MKLKNIAIASAFVAGNLFVIGVSAQTILFNGNPTSGFAAGPLSFGYGYTLGTNYSLASGATITYSYTGYVVNPSTGQGAPNLSLRAYSTSALSGVGVGYSSNLITTTSASYSGSFVLSANAVGLGLAGGGYAGQSPTQYYITNLLVTVSGTTPVDLAPNAYALRSVYNAQTAALNAGLSYDCNVFDKEGFCLSTGGRYSVATSPETKTTSGLLIGSYKYDKNIRLGAWVDQNLSTQNAGSIKLSNGSPLFGVFGAWSQSNDGLGYEVKVSAGYGDKDADVTRTSTNVGSAQLHMRGISTVSSYGLPVEGGLIAAPYVGVKYTSISRAGYTEAGSGGLTYDNLNQESTTAVAGAKLSGKIDAETSFVVSAGVEHDVNHHIGQYSASSSNSVAFNPVIQKTRPVVSAGVYYDIDKTQRLGLNATVRQEAFQSTSSTTALATYTVGF